MKTETLKSIFTVNKVRIAVALLFFFCLGLGWLQPSVAQKNQRRVTAVQLGNAAEGSRVTVSSDAPLNDYEGFRRGDRFYVKIPWADFVSAAPRFRGDGFDDVQVQKVGDGVVLSFKLQPGAMARIDQRGNRLDVIFSVAKKVFNAPAIADASRNNPGNLSPYTSASSANDDSAGPLPPGSASTRERYAEPFDQSSFGRSSRSPRGAKRRLTIPTNDLSGTQALAAASPLPSPAPTFSPATAAGYPPLAAVSPSQLKPNSNSSTAASAANVSSWSERRAAITRWISANRLATLLGALILLSLIIYLISGLRRRSTTAVKNRDVKSKVQPKYTASDSLDELSPKQTQKLSDSESVVANKETSVTASEPSKSWTLPKRSSAAVTEDIDKEDREVFEL